MRVGVDEEGAGARECGCGCGVGGSGWSPWQQQQWALAFWTAHCTGWLALRISRERRRGHGEGAFVGGRVQSWSRRWGWGAWGCSQVLPTEHDITLKGVASLPVSASAHTTCWEGRGGEGRPTPPLPTSDLHSVAPRRTESFRWMGVVTAAMLVQQHFHWRS